MAVNDEADLSTQRISVVITTRNRANLLRGAIGSVLQSPLIASPGAITVVDDDSGDSTAELVRSFGVRYLRVDCHSPGGSRNAALPVVQTPYVTFLDDDDVWLPGNMEAQLAALEHCPDAGFAYGRARCATAVLEPLPNLFPQTPLPSGHVPDGLHRCGYPQLGVVLFRKETLVEVGGFNPHIPYGQDADLMLRIAADHAIVGVDVVGILHRLRPPSMGRSDYFWDNSRRNVMRWRPKGLGVSWKTATKFRIETRGRFVWRFYEDAATCLTAGRNRDARVCLWRLFRVSPAHALRHSSTFGSMFLASLRGRSQEDEVESQRFIVDLPD